MINIEEEEQRSKEFLAKLNQIQKASKQIKTKNIQSIQRQEWAKEYQQLQKAEKMLSYDLEQKLLHLEIINQLPQFCLTTQLEQNRLSYKSLKDELIYQLQNLKRITDSLKNQQLPQLKNQAKQTNNVDEMFESLKEFFSQTKDQLDQLEEDENYGDVVDLFVQNTKNIDNFIETINTDVLNDKLILYQQESDGDEFQILENYCKAVKFLQERYDLEALILKPKEQLELSDEILYLASSNSIHAMQRLIIHFPKVPRSQLQMAIDYVRQQKDIQKRIDILRRQWSIEYGQLQNKTEQILQENQNEKLVKNQKWLQYLEFKQHRLRVQEILEEKRNEFEQKQKEISENQEALKQQQLLVSKEKYDEWLQHKAQINQLAVQYRQEKEEKRSAIILQQQRELELARKEQEIKLQQQKPYVQQRQEKEIVKIQDKIQKAETKKNQIQLNQQRIENVINQYSIRPKVDRDFNRLQSQTQAQIIRKQTKYDKADKIQLTNVTGFNIDQLMSDMRFRLQAVLGEQGLHQAQYAKELLIGMAKPNNR
ncbi:hypothetical protein pb186bvf_011981 [Paramecium bursaria]